MLRLSVFSMVVAFVALCPIVEAQDDAYQQLLKARKGFDTELFLAAKERLIAEATDSPDDYRPQFAAAESYRLWATWLRNERNTRSLSSKENKKRRGEQAAAATAGIPYAERAVDLAKSNADSAQANRVLGDLYSHLISGMVSGMRNGPKAKLHINRGLTLAPDNAECKRAIALMYLHNPPFNGGDVPRAIKTFTECCALAPESDIYPVLLAMAYRKAKEPELALKAARKALDMNSENADAVALVKAIENEQRK